MITRKKTKRRLVRYGLLAFYVALLGVTVFFVLHGSGTAQSTPGAKQTSSASLTSVNSTANPLDQLSSADIAVQVAELSHIPEATHVRNQADSDQAVLAMMSASPDVAAKSQVVASAFDSNRDIKTYVVKAGDTVSSIAAQFNVTSDSVRWSNNLTGESVQAGQTLYIPPVDGIVYTVRSGDTVDSLAQKYKARKDQIIAYNDAELSGIQVGERIIIPNGQIVQTYSSYGYGFVGGGGLRASYGGFGSCYYGGQAYSNYGYDCGWCTWWAAMRRAQLGSPVPSNLGDAYTWRYNSSAMGMSGGITPRAGAVMAYTAGDHVGVVEKVNDDGSFWISEMNASGFTSIDGQARTGGWGVVDYRLLPASSVGSQGLWFIY